MRKTTLGDRLRYAFDNYMSRGTVALLFGLAMASLLVIFFIGVVISAFRISPPGEDPVGLVEAMWLSLMRTLDAGTMGGDTGWGFRLASLAVTLGGIFVISALIGVINNGMNLMNVSSFYQQIVKGGVILAALLIDRALSRRSG